MSDEDGLPPSEPAPVPVPVPVSSASGSASSPRKRLPPKPASSASRLHSSNSLSTGELPLNSVSPPLPVRHDAPLRHPPPSSAPPMPAPKPRPQALSNGTESPRDDSAAPVPSQPLALRKSSSDVASPVAGARRSPPPSSAAPAPTLGLVRTTSGNTPASTDPRKSGSGVAPPIAPRRAADPEAKVSPRMKGSGDIGTLHEHSSSSPRVVAATTATADQGTSPRVTSPAAFGGAANSTVAPVPITSGLPNNTGSNAPSPPKSPKGAILAVPSSPSLPPSELRHRLEQEQANDGAPRTKTISSSALSRVANSSGPANSSPMHQRKFPKVAPPTGPTIRAGGSRGKQLPLDAEMDYEPSEFDLQLFDYMMENSKPVVVGDEPPARDRADSYF